MTRLLGDFARDVTKAVQTGGLPQADNPIRVDSAEQGRARVRERIAQLMDTIRARYMELRAQRVAAVDTPAEYAAVQAKCPGGWR